MFDRLRARHRRRPAARTRRLGVEPLEARDVPAWAADPLATFAGDVAAPHQPDWVQMEVQTTSPRALLTFESAGADGSAFVPGRLAVFAGPAGHVLTTGAVTGPGYALRAVGSGTVFARVGAAQAGTGAFNLEVGLAGDVNGDHQVDSQDLDAIRALRGTRARQAGYVAAADVNHNGVIGLRDLALARRNLGNAVTVGPLTADQFLFAGSDDLGLRDTRATPVIQPGLSLVMPPILNGAAIPVQSFSWGVSRPPGSRATASDLFLSMKTSAASPSLMLHALDGQMFPTVTLNLGRRTASSTPVLRWELSDVQVTSYQTSGAGATTPQESISLNFTKIMVTYWPTLPNGQIGAPVSAGWDFVLNRKL